MLRLATSYEESVIYIVDHTECTQRGGGTDKNNVQQRLLLLTIDNGQWTLNTQYPITVTVLKK